MPTSTAPSPSKALLDAVRSQREARDAAEVALLVQVVDWAVAHTVTDLDQAASFVEAFGDTGLRVAGNGAPQVRESATWEVAQALKLSSEGGKKYVGEAVELRYRLPRLWAATMAGDVEVWRARKIASFTITLCEDGAAYVDDRLAFGAGKVSFTQAEKLVAEALMRFDPERVEAERKAAAERRHADVHVRDHGVDGLVRVDAVLDLADALDLEEALQQGAQALAEAGCEESLTVRRSMALGELARGGEGLTFRRPMVVHVHEDSPNVARCGNTRHPISVEQVREWCGVATKVTVKPVVDLAERIHVEAYEVPDRLDAQVALRDHTCVFPRCTLPAESCDSDHVRAYDEGGETASDNIAPLCRRHHRAKTHSRWRYQVLDLGVYLWISPNGLRILRDHTGTTLLHD